MIYALVPARGGSKGIPMKNIKLMHGKPLIYWVLKAATKSVVDKTFVATDSREIEDVVNSFGFKNVEVIGRSVHSATDHAKTEIVMEEFCKAYTFETLVVLQPTSPLIWYDDINDAITIFGGCDSILPAVVSDRFIWKEVHGNYKPTNYDPKNRPMRQDSEVYYVENGYIYIVNREKFLIDKCRLHGNINTYLFPDYTIWEPDNPNTWDIVETLLKEYGDIL